VSGFGGKHAALSLQVAQFGHESERQTLFGPSKRQFGVEQQEMFCNHTHSEC